MFNLTWKNETISIPMDEEFIKDDTLAESRGLDLKDLSKTVEVPEQNFNDVKWFKKTWDDEFYHEDWTPEILGRFAKLVGYYVPSQHKQALNYILAYLLKQKTPLIKKKYHDDDTFDYIFNEQLLNDFHGLDVNAMKVHCDNKSSVVLDIAFNKYVDEDEAYNAWKNRTFKDIIYLTKLGIWGFLNHKYDVKGKYINKCIRVEDLVTLRRFVVGHANVIKKVNVNIRRGCRFHSHCYSGLSCILCIAVKKRNMDIVTLLWDAGHPYCPLAYDYALGNIRECPEISQYIAKPTKKSVSNNLLKRKVDKLCNRVIVLEKELKRLKKASM